MIKHNPEECANCGRDVHPGSTLCRDCIGACGGEKEKTGARKYKMNEVGHKKMKIIIKTKTQHGHPGWHRPRHGIKKRAEWVNRKIATLGKDDPKFEKILQLLQED